MTQLGRELIDVRRVDRALGDEREESQARALGTRQEGIGPGRGRAHAALVIDHAARRHHGSGHRRSRKLDSPALGRVLELAIGVRDAGPHRTEAARRREEEIHSEGDEAAHHEVHRVEQGDVDHHGSSRIEREEHEGEYADECTARADRTGVAARSRHDERDEDMRGAEFAREATEQDAYADPESRPQHDPQPHSARVGAVRDGDEEQAHGDGERHVDPPRPEPHEQGQRDEDARAQARHPLDVRTLQTQARPERFLRDPPLIHPRSMPLGASVALNSTEWWSRVSGTFT